jgi:hypothetical protein
LQELLLQVIPRARLNIRHRRETKAKGAFVGVVILIEDIQAVKA